MQYSRPVRSVIPLSRASSSVRSVNSATVISSPAGLPRASLIAASRLSSGKVTVPGSVGVVAGSVVVGAVAVGVVVVGGAPPQEAINSTVINRAAIINVDGGLLIFHLYSLISLAERYQACASS